MIASRRPVDQDHLEDRPNGAPSLGATAAAVMGLVAAWIAAGSTGLMAGVFRNTLVWMFAAAIVVAARPGRRRWIWLAAAVAALVVLPLFAPTQPAVGALSVALLLAVLAWDREGLDGRAFLVATIAVAVLGVYRLACESIPTVWMVSGAMGLGLGRVVEAITGRPLWIGASFAGLDVLVAMAVVYAIWLRWTRPPRAARAVYAAAGILAGYLCYLAVLAFATDLAAALPEPPTPPSLDAAEYRPQAWSVLAALGTMIPWNLPLFAALVEAGVAALMFRWASWSPVEPKEHDTVTAGRSLRGFVGAIAVLAVVVAMLLTLSLSRSDLTGKTIVAHQRGHVNWSTPDHEQLAPGWAGAYGLLPTFVSSLGGKMSLSADLSDEDLAEADVLLLVHPTAAWKPEELARIEEFVRRGGSLLVVAGPAVQEEGDRAAVNDVLKPTGMAIRDDVAVGVTSRWLDACLTLSHPATVGLNNNRGGFGLRLSSSIQTCWPARPILVGQWGFADPGSNAAATGAFRFEPGEKLGDLILAAQRPLGRGTVVVLADDSCLSNATNAGAYEFTGRLLSYLASRPSSPQDAWRQTLGLLGCVALVGLLVWRPGSQAVVAISAAMAISIVVATCASQYATRVLPSGDNSSAKIAYIDASHLESYNDQPWSNDGIDGLKLMLARNGYLPLMLPALTTERLDGASLLVSIGPARSFSAAERAAVREFVRRGGVLISTTGATESAASWALLGEFNFDVPSSPVPPGDSRCEPEPVGRYPEEYGRIDLRYFNAADRGLGNYQARTWFFSPWPVECRADNAEVLVRGFDNVPLVVRRPFGDGLVVVIGDTGFALNQNLGYFDGEMVEGVADNADFWRWLFSRIHAGAEWAPPDPALRKGTPKETKKPKIEPPAGKEAGR